METVVVIPSRFASSRYPGKPLISVAGTTLLQRVWRIGAAVPGVDRVLVATDDEQIAQHAKNFGAEVVMTSIACRNGSERACEAIRLSGIEAKVVVNLQGDAVLTPPWLITALIDEMRLDPEVQIATPAVRLSREGHKTIAAMKSRGVVSGTTVTFNNKGDAMYFSKGMIPFVRAMPEGELSPVFQHIGLYAYRFPTLERYVGLSPGQFEQVEQLEQLRALEHGIPIRVVQVSMRGRTMWSIDNPEDVPEVEQIIRREGELV